MNDFENIWQEALTRIHADTSDFSFNEWIKKLKPLSAYSGSFVLEAPNSAIRGLANKRQYTDIFLRAINAVSSGEFTSIEVSIPGQTIKEQPVPVQEESSVLNPRYVFDTFVVGVSNRYAHAGAVAITEAPGKIYNPLYIYGNTGLGKTHLMHAIGNAIKSNNPAAKVVYATSEQFTNDLITAIGSIDKDANNKFRDKYRNADVLLVDDIQFFSSNKYTTNEEFFHTFNSLYEASKQIVLSSDKHPRDIPKLEERIRSRFQCGLTVDIKEPNYETRVAILKNKAKIDSLDVSDDVINYIAEMNETNIRVLESTLLQVKFYCSLHNSPMTLPLAKEALKGIIDMNKPRAVTIEKIKQVVCDYYNISLEDIDSKKRSRNIVTPRHVAIYLARQLMDISSTDIGAAFGGRDHSTILSAFDSMENKLKEDSMLQAVVNELTSIIRN